jgi:hypothetical protein
MLILFGQVQIRLYHICNQALQVVFWFPAQLFLAFDGSPIKRSTSVGLKYFGSTFTTVCPGFNASALSPSSSTFFGQYQ